MNWSERQLNMFKGKRQRGKRPAAADEFALHCLIADVLKRWCYPTWRYTHIPLGAPYPGPQTGARMKRMGLTPGWPDFMFFHSRGKVCFIELKREGETASEVQEELAFFLMQAGHGYLLTNNFNDALGALKDWGVVPARISTFSANPDDPKDVPWPAQEETPIEER